MRVGSPIPREITFLVPPSKFSSMFSIRRLSMPLMVMVEVALASWWWLTMLLLLFIATAPVSILCLVSLCSLCLFGFVKALVENSEFDFPNTTRYVVSTHENRGFGSLYSCVTVLRTLLRVKMYLNGFFQQICGRNLIIILLTCEPLTFYI